MFNNNPNPTGSHSDSKTPKMQPSSDFSAIFIFSWLPGFISHLFVKKKYFQDIICPRRGPTPLYLVSVKSTRCPLSSSKGFHAAICCWLAIFRFTNVLRRGQIWTNGSQEIMISRQQYQFVSVRVETWLYVILFTNSFTFHCPPLCPVGGLLFQPPVSSQITPVSP